MTTFVIARLTFREAFRRKIVWAALILGILFLIVYGLGFYFIKQDIERSMGGRMALLERNEIFNFFLIAGLYAVNFLTIAMSVLTSVATLSSEISTGTIQTLVTKPIRRWEIVMGKWLGFVVMLTLYLILMAGGSMAIVRILAAYSPPNPFQGFVLLWLNANLMLCVSLFGGSFLSTIANGVLAFGLYGVAFVGGWIEQIGSLVNNQMAVNIGVVCSLILPSEALWKRVAFEMQSPLVASIGFSPFTASSVPSTLMIGYAILYSIAALLLAFRLFGRRDL